ncbi:MAG TPA: AAA family ATPase [Terriglobia bacterium]|nr:AAA family ATPase [Terriglobia bacterium]
MKINNIHIDGFGVWNDKTWESLGPGLNVFHGPNEIGKSTLMAFIRSMFFGFEKRGSPRRYEPAKGGVHGGWLDLLVGDTQLRVERKPGRHVRGEVTVYTGDAKSDETSLERLLGGTTRTLYHNVFAFGLEELEHFHTLQENEIAIHISGAGLGIGASRWAAVQRDLEDRQSALFLPRGQNSTINVAFKELEVVRDDLDRTEHQPEDYFAAHEARARLSAELSGLEEAVAEVSRRIEHYARRLKARPNLERRSKIEARLRELPPVDHFPEGGVERLNLLSNQRGALISEREKNQAETERRRLRRLQMHLEPDECARRAQILESLRTLAPRIDAAGRIYQAGGERRDAVAQERRTLVAALAGIVPPSWAAFLVFISLLWFGVVGLAFASHEFLAALLGVVSVVVMFWHRNRMAQVAAIEQQVTECSARLNACESELRKIENEAREIESEIRKLTGRSEVTQADIDVRAAELDRVSKISDEIRSLDEASARSEADLERILGQIADAAKNIAALLAEASAGSEEEFLERVEVFKQRRQLRQELEKIPVEPPEPGMLFDMRADEEAAFETAKRELAELEQRLLHARHESGRIEERITMMEKSEERSRALSRQETILARIDEAAEHWAVLTLCRAMLDETRKIYETERQPEVLRQASSFFSVMTEGRYIRVIAPLDGSEIQVERADTVRLSPQILSRGTAEQLYLSMRLALVREYANHVDPLPVVFDDIFVNFDPERSRTSFKAVRDLCSTHQVLLFTCHPHLVAQVEEIVPDAKLFAIY